MTTSRQDEEIIDRIQQAFDELAAHLPAHEDPSGDADQRRFVSLELEEQPSRRRRITLAGSGAAAAVAAAAVVVWIALPDSSRDSGSSSPPTISSPAPPSTTPPNVSLALPDAQLVRDEKGNATAAHAVLWRADDGSYLTLTVRPGLAQGPAGLPARMRLDDTFPPDAGRAWIGDYTVASETPQQATASDLWWQRPNGDVWILTAYWSESAAMEHDTVRHDRLRHWARSTVATIDTPTNYTSDDTTLRPVAADRAGPRSTRTRIWRVDDEELVLLEIEDSDAAGFSNVLARGRPTAITVAGRPGWLTHDDENVLVDWQTDSDGPWATLTIPAGLTARLDQLLGALQLAPTTGTANTEGSATANPAVTSPSPTPPTNLMTRQLNGRLTMDGGRAPGISVEVPGMVTAQPVDGGPPTVTETDANGRFEMTLRPGTYRLTATSPSYDAGRTPCTSPGVDVVEITDDADTTVDISCPMR